MSYGANRMLTYMSIGREFERAEATVESLVEQLISKVDGDVERQARLRDQIL